MATVEPTDALCAPGAAETAHRRDPASRRAPARSPKVVGRLLLAGLLLAAAGCADGGGSPGSGTSTIVDADYPYGQPVVQWDNVGKGGEMGIVLCGTEQSSSCTNLASSQHADWYPDTPWVESWAWTDEDFPGGVPCLLMAFGQAYSVVANTGGGAGDDPATLSMYYQTYSTGESVPEAYDVFSFPKGAFITGLTPPIYDENAQTVSSYVGLSTGEVMQCVFGGTGAKAAECTGYQSFGAGAVTLAYDAADQLVLASVADDAVFAWNLGTPADSAWQIFAPFPGPISQLAANDGVVAVLLENGSVWQCASATGDCIALGSAGNTAGTAATCPGSYVAVTDQGIYAVGSDDGTDGGLYLFALGFSGQDPQVVPGTVMGSDGNPMVAADAANSGVWTFVAGSSSTQATYDLVHCVGAGCAPVPGATFYANDTGGGVTDQSGVVFAQITTVLDTDD